MGASPERIGESRWRVTLLRRERYMNLFAIELRKGDTAYGLSTDYQNENHVMLTSERLA